MQHHIFILGSLILGAGPQAQAQRPPNVVLVMMDDLGYGEARRSNAAASSRLHTVGRAGIVRQFDRVHARILARLQRTHSRDWRLTMHYPTRWDPRFRIDMRLADPSRYPIDHLRHHRSQTRAT